MKIISNTGGVFATSSYLVVDEPTKQAVVFDAPDHTTAPLLDLAEKNGWDVVGLWLTHGHIDHIADHSVVTGRFPNAQVLIHPSDEPKLRKPRSMYALPFETAARSADGYLSDGQVLHIGANAVRVIHTPGHSPGHVGFHLETEDVLIGGDLILMGAVGRTDFPRLQLPRPAGVAPAGDAAAAADAAAAGAMAPPSTLADEAAENPYVREATGG